MDLDYQSHGNVDFKKQLNHLDKMTSRLNVTLKDVPESQQITKYQKQQIVKFVSADQASLLFKFIEKEVIAPYRQVGVKGSRWNLLHVCAKYDAVECTKLLLKKTYQQDQDDYLQIINVKTAEGYTALMISVIYQANKTLKLLLRLGGSDHSIIESSKLRAYELALNYQNQIAIQELIVYEDRCKKHMFINKQELMEEIVVVEESSWFSSCVACLFDYLLCLNGESVDNQPQQNPILQKFNSLLKGDEKVDEIDLVKIGSRRDIEDYQIEWKKLSTIQSHKFVLFDSFKPLDICENQFSLRHNLILFQALSDYSWIVKRAVNKGQGNIHLKLKPDLHKFIINLYKNFTLMKIQVDECVPFIKQREDIMFLSNQNEIWPMMLQKGLAKFYSSYILLNNLVPCEALQDITAFYSHSIQISAFSKDSIVSNLQELSMKGYLILLEGREKTDLNISKESQIYSILNYYEKGSNKKILVSCPNVVANWKQPKDKQLTMIKAHFNKHNQSCLWIDEQKLDYYFKSATICYLREDYLRSELRIKMKIKGDADCSNKDVLEVGEKLVVKNYKKAIFFRFKVDKKVDDPIVLQLVDMETKHRFDLTSLSGWKNEGAEVMIHESESQNCKQLAKMVAEPGEYTCMYQLSEKQIMSRPKNHSQLNKSIIRVRKEGQQELKSVGSQIKQDSIDEPKKKVKLNLGPQHLKQLMLLSWWVEPLQVEYLQEQFGTIEWLSHFKNYSISNWAHLMKDKKGEDCFLYETVNQKTVFLIKANSVKKAFLQLVDFSQCGSKSIIEGKLVQNEAGFSIEMVQQTRNKNFFYAVVSNISVEDFERQKRIRFLYEYQ